MLLFDTVELLRPYMRFGHYGEGAHDLPAYCPFHERSSRPTLYIYVGPPTDTKFPGAAFCFKCNEGWSLPGLLSAVEAPSSIVKQVRDHLGQLPKPKRDPGNLVDLEMDTLPEALLGAYEFIPKALLDDGFTRETIQLHDLGFDRMKKRITFPIRNHHGQFVALSGRAVREWDPMRYKVYTGKDFGIGQKYDPPKGKVLWGLDKFWMTRLTAGKDLPPLILCEGFKAKMWVEQAGFPHSVALMGTWVTKEQLFLLQCISSRIILLLDNDIPGITAVNKQAERLVRQGLELEFGNYGTRDEISPDDLSIERVNQAIDTSLTLRQWRNFHDVERPPLKKYNE
jgi:hypothetical protein